MKLTKMLALIAIFSVTTANAADATAATETTATTTTSTSSIKRMYNKIKESPFSMAYLNDSYSSFNIKGITSIHYLYNHYKVTSYDKVSLIPTLSTDLTKNTTTGETPANTRFENIQLRYSRSSLLRQKDHGVNLSAQLRYYHQAKKTQVKGGTDGYGRLLLLGSKSFDRLTLSLNTDSILYNKNSNAAGNLRTHNISFTQSYSFTDSVNLSTSVYWYKKHLNKKNANNIKNGLSFSEYAYYSIALDYSFNNGISISPYIEGKLTKAQDGRDGFTQDLFKNSYVGASLYYSWF